MRTVLAAAAVACVVASTLVAVPAAAAPATPWRPGTQAEKSVPGKDFVARKAAADPGLASVVRAAPAVRWPGGGTADVVVPAASRTNRSGAVRAGALPVWLGASGDAQRRLRVRVHDRAAAERAGVAGLLLSVEAGSTTTSAATAPVPVQVDYSAFRDAYGGDWASRLRLVRLPACALSTPERPECRTSEPVPSTNLVREGRVSATVAPGASVLAVAAAPAGSAGSYAATPLSASASWHAGGASGDFAWSYPLPSPASVGGPVPDLALTYSSGSVDGRIAATNNQTTWAGEGWDLNEGFIERRYKSCADDVSFTPKPYDLCWETDNAFMLLNGNAVELVKDDATGAWHPRDDDGSRVERLTGAVNGDNDGEHWKVTAVDGTQYFFGLNRLPGWASGNEVTNSTWAVPVFGNDAGEPCNASTFAASYCTQAWRWNLDYIVDPNGNAMSYFYDTESNSYGRNRTASAGTAYTRGGYLKRIDYGQRADTLYTVLAPVRVTFAVEERCAAGATCGTGTITKDTAKNWPDVPYDLNCAAGATCTDLFAPTFWTRKRLASVTTQVLSSGTYQDVDTWAFGYQFREPGDGTSPQLWLASIVETGKVGGSQSQPAVTFAGVQLENRVDALEGIPAMYRWRVSDVYDESGGHVRVNYSAKDCVRTALPAPETNTRRCFPAYWTPEGATAPQLDWFHKYAVTQVLEDDQSGLAGIEQTDYEYLGGGAWHHDDNELVPAKYRTWSEWRGFARVRTTHGASTTARSQTEALFLRGMEGTTVTDSQGVAVTDQAPLVGFVRETTVYTGAGGTVLSSEINDPWVSAATATHGGTKAYLTEVARQRERTALAAGGWRWTDIQRSFDGYGLVTQVNDLGDTSTAADDRCTRTGYARNSTLWLMDYESRVESVGVACTVTPSYPADAISDDLTYYDGSTTLGAAPTKGDETLAREVSGYTGSTPSYSQVSRATYDANGRILVLYDELDHPTTTAYTPSTGGPVVTKTVTNALGHVETTTLDPARGVPTAVVDANGKRTELTYDPLGRLTAVWLADRPKASGNTPSLRFSYLVRTDAPSVITTETVRDDGTYRPEYAFFDGQLRQRQTQVPAPDGGRVVTDTFYDSRGLEVKRNEAYWNSGTAGTTLLTGIADGAVPGQTITGYDGAERETAEIFQSFAVEQWRTTTSYGGDRVSVDPPDGDTATTTIVDADDRVVELRQYTSGAPSGGYEATTYTYTKGGDLGTVTDPAGNVRRFGYDVRGRKVTAVDPDTGTSTYTYDNADHLLTSTDARGQVLQYTYDDLGRRTGLADGAGTKRAAWSYDTVLKGQLAASTRYVDGNAYTIAVNGYDAVYRSLGTTVTIPASEGKLAGTYTMNTGYTATGLPLLVSYPEAGGLPAETLRYGYDAAGRLKTAQTGLATLLTAATYTPYGEALQSTFSAVSGTQLVQTFSYDPATRRLVRAQLDRSVSTPHLADVNYTYDAAGNVKRIADTVSADTQCFTYDHLRRLTQAWTATNACATAPSTSVVGGPAPYWQGWTYDSTGNRLTETNYGTTNTYAYPAAGSARPHALSSVTRAGGTDTYGYDAAGNTTARTVNGVAQALTWDPEGHLATVTQGGKTTGYLYTADGDRLIGRDSDAVTLYLDGSELKLTKSTNTVANTRYYGLGGVTAVRSGGTGSANLALQVTDPHGTAMMSVSAADGNTTERRYLPFGGLRGAAPASWPGTRGFVGGTVDTGTGLVHLGAREYDTGTGRFISADPLVDPNDPQQLNGYAYANNAPSTDEDADGLLTGHPTQRRRVVYTKRNSGHPTQRRRVGAVRDGHPTQRRRVVYTKRNSGHPTQRRRVVYTKRNSGHPTQRFKPGTAKYKQHVKDLKRQEQWLKDQAAKHRAQRQKAAAEAARKKGWACHGFFGCIGRGLRNAWDNTIGDHWRGLTQGVVWVAGTLGTIGCLVFTAGLCAGVLSTYLVIGAIGAGVGVATYGTSAGKKTTNGFIASGSIGAVTAVLPQYVGRVGFRAATAAAGSSGGGVGWRAGVREIIDNPSHLWPP